MFLFLNFPRKSESLSIIKVIFTESQIKRTSYYITYKIDRFIVDVGSSIGLMLGLAIIIELFLYACKMVNKHVRKVIMMCHQRIIVTFGITSQSMNAITDNPTDGNESIEIPEIRVNNDRGEELYVEDLE